MVILVIGLPGTGKTYFAKAFAEEIGAAYINTDIIRKKNSLLGKYDETTFKKVYELLKTEMLRKIAAGDDCIIDATFQQKYTREIITNAATQRGHRFFTIRMSASEETIKKRLKKERKNNEADYDVYLHLKDNFDPVLTGYLALRSDVQDIEEMIEKAKQYIFDL